MGSAAMFSSSVASSTSSGGLAIPTGTGSANLGDRSAVPVASDAESSSAGKSAEECLAVARSFHKGLQCAASAVEGKETRELVPKTGQGHHKSSLFEPRTYPAFGSISREQFLQSALPRAEGCLQLLLLWVGGRSSLSLART